MGESEKKGNQSQSSFLLGTSLAALVIILIYLLNGCGNQHLKQSLPSEPAQTIHTPSTSIQSRPAPKNTISRAQHQPQTLKANSPSEEGTPPSPELPVKYPSLSDLSALSGITQGNQYRSHPAEEYQDNSDIEPFYTVTLNAEDSSIFFMHFRKAQVNTHRSPSSPTRSFELENSTRAFSLRCTHVIRDEVSQPFCQFRFYTSRNHPSFQLRYNAAEGLIRMTLNSASDISLLKSFFASSSASIRTQEELVENSKLVPRLSLDCESAKDACILEAYRDFQNVGDTR